MTEHMLIEILEQDEKVFGWFEARFQVGYVKEPKTIDRAEFFVVDFEETRRKPTYSEGQRSINVQ